MRRDPVHTAGFIASACLFASIFLIAMIVYGETGTRVAAAASALLACMAQFTAQDITSMRVYRASIYLAYAAFILAVASLLLFCAGR